MERVVPREKWLYNDRGMVKWMGWILSDHQAYLDGQRQQNAAQAVPPAMSVDQISSVLQQSWQDHVLISLQLNAIVDHHLVPVMVGEVVGFEHGQLYFRTVTDAIKCFNVGAIRNAQLSAHEKWWLNGNTLR